MRRAQNPHTLCYEVLPWASSMRTLLPFASIGMLHALVSVLSSFPVWIVCHRICYHSSFCISATPYPFSTSIDSVDRFVIRSLLSIISDTHFVKTYPVPESMKGARLRLLFMTDSCLATSCACLNVRRLAQLLHTAMADPKGRFASMQHAKALTRLTLVQFLIALTRTGGARNHE